MNVTFLLDDRDTHGIGCDCGLCNANGVSFGVGIYPVSTEGVVGEEVLARAYAASESSALHNAKLICEKEGYLAIEKE